MIEYMTIWFHLMPIVYINYIPLVSFNPIMSIIYIYSQIIYIYIYIYIYTYNITTYMMVTIWFHLMPVVFRNYIPLVSFNTIMPIIYIYTQY